MGDKVIDFQAAKERIKSARVSDSDFSIEKEIAWVDEQLEVADMELEEITNEMEELTQYIIELTNYMAGISVALSIRDAGFDDWEDKLRTERQNMSRTPLASEGAPIQFELDLDDETLIVDFIPEFDLDDN